MKAFIPLTLMSVLCSSVAIAHNTGDFFVRGGAAAIMPDESSDDVLGTGELEIGDDTQLGITLTYMATDNVGVELLLSTPFTHEVSTDGLGNVAEVTLLPPTLMAQYYFGDATSTVRPYVGAGLNYTFFFEEEGKGALSGTDVSLDSSLGFAAQVGIDVNFSGNWFANASIWYVDINTDVSTVVGTFNADIDPIVAMVGVGYYF